MFTALGENNMSDEGWEEQRRLSRCRGRMSSTQHALMITPWDGCLGTDQVDLSVQRASWGCVFLTFNPLLPLCEPFRASSRTTV